MHIHHCILALLLIACATTRVHADDIDAIMLGLTRDEARMAELTSIDVEPLKGERAVKTGSLHFAVPENWFIAPPIVVRESAWRFTFSVDGRTVHGALVDALQSQLLSRWHPQYTGTVDRWVPDRDRYLNAFGSDLNFLIYCYNLTPTRVLAMPPADRELAGWLLMKVKPSGHVVNTLLRSPRAAAIYGFRTARSMRPEDAPRPPLHFEIYDEKGVGRFTGVLFQPEGAFDRATLERIMHQIAGTAEWQREEPKQ